MPTYEYACDACGHTFEREQRITDKPIKKCPTCGASKARRMITQGNFILKGGGWYADGYASGKASSSKEAKTESKSSDKSDSASKSSSDKGKSKSSAKKGGTAA